MLNMKKVIGSLVICGLVFGGSTIMAASGDSVGAKIDVERYKESAIKECMTSTIDHAAVAGTTKKCVGVVGEIWGGPNSNKSTFEDKGAARYIYRIVCKKGQPTKIVNVSSLGSNYFQARIYGGEDRRFTKASMKRAPKSIGSTLGVAR